MSGLGRNNTATSVKAAVTAMQRSNVEKPPAFTTGPSSHTAPALTPSETVKRMPLTRERWLSST